MIHAAHSQGIPEILLALDSTPSGLGVRQAAERLNKYGRNVLPTQKSPGVTEVFLRQFLNPIVYILLAAAVVSSVLSDWKDAIFIAVILLINALVGTIQEYGAEKSVKALKKLSASKATVERGGEVVEIDAECLVPGDLVLLESGKKVPADLRLIDSHSLYVDESLLTGESNTVEKSHHHVHVPETPLADRKNLCFSGTIVARGRARGVVIATGLSTELGKIAESLSSKSSTQHPLVIRVSAFTQKIAVLLLVATALLGIILWFRGYPWQEVMMSSVALAVSAIPEGLPVAITVVLTVASLRMAKRNVIVRELPAAQSLGSCTVIATDKTGTLTVNQLTISRIALPGQDPIQVGGVGLSLEGGLQVPSEALNNEHLRSLVQTGVLCNEAHLIHQDGRLSGTGDSVDLAFLVLAHKVGIKPIPLQNQTELVDEVPFEAENQYAATCHQFAGQFVISVKGALEKLIPMCQLGLSEQNSIIQQADVLAEQGFRILALAYGGSYNPKEPLAGQLRALKFAGLVGMIDPLREEAAEAVRACQKAGIQVVMVTGDHPKTALAMARSIGLASDMSEVMTGSQLKALDGFEAQLREMCSRRVFARVEPRQKLEIVQWMIKCGNFVAVTGDGANDAPALKAAHVGIAMGRSGTDVAKEASNLIVSDDRFASIVAGVEEGRIAYANIRKVVYLLVSTGVAEIFMFALSILTGTQLPLTPVQILWLNLVTNGIQDVFLAFEPGEGDELSKMPRSLSEPFFNHLMIRNVLLSAAVMGLVSFGYFYYRIQSGNDLYMVRNETLLLMVLFENIMVGNARSETRSAFSLGPFRNTILLFGTVGALFVHISAMYVPGVQGFLGVAPVDFSQWILLIALSLLVFIVVEIDKKIRSALQGS